MKIEWWKFHAQVAKTVANSFEFLKKYLYKILFSKGIYLDTFIQCFETDSTPTNLIVTSRLKFIYDILNNDEPYIIEVKNISLFCCFF